MFSNTGWIDATGISVAGRMLSARPPPARIQTAECFQHCSAMSALGFVLYICPFITFWLAVELLLHSLRFKNEDKKTAQK